MNLKRAAAKALAAHIGARIPPLVGNARSVSAEPEEYATFPALYVLPGKMRLETAQEAPLDEAAGIYTVGYATGFWELRLVHRTPYAREELEQQVLDLFFETAGAPGYLAIELFPTVNGRRSTVPLLCWFRLQEEEWSEEKGFEKKRFSYLDVEVELPRIVLRAGTRTADEVVVLVVQTASMARDQSLPLTPAQAITETVEIEGAGLTAGDGCELVIT